jgi:hypothetical protein
VTETRTVHDPFLGKDVEVSDALTDRLRGKYAQGPTLPNGEPEFGWREYPVPPIQREAAAEIERLRALLEWRPIETAPKDMMFIWACPKGDGKFGIGLAYQNVSGGWSDAYGDRVAPCEATLWATLPPAPESKR